MRRWLVRRWWPAAGAAAGVGVCGAALAARRWLHRPWRHGDRRTRSRIGAGAQHEAIAQQQHDRQRHDRADPAIQLPACKTGDRIGGIDRALALQALRREFKEPCACERERKPDRQRIVHVGAANTGRICVITCASGHAAAAWNAPTRSTLRRLSSANKPVAIMQPPARRFHTRSPRDTWNPDWFRARRTSDVSIKPTSWHQGTGHGASWEKPRARRGFRFLIVDPVCTG